MSRAVLRSLLSRFSRMLRRAAIDADDIEPSPLKSNGGSAAATKQVQRERAAHR